MSASSGFTLHYHGQVVVCRPHETVLEAMLRSGVEIDFSCKSGVCHRCMVRCIEGQPQQQAIKKLPKYQQDTGCMLACQCHPTGDMMLAPKSPEDLVTRCVGTTLNPSPTGGWRLAFESMRTIRYQTGQLTELMDDQMENPVLATLVSVAEQDEGLIVEIEPDTARPAWLTAATFTDLEFCLRGPLPIEPKQAVVPIPADPVLWQQLGGDQVIRAVLTTFYQMVYADTELAPFFERVTMERIIGKQFAFLKQNILGEPVFLGEKPRNTHNWMVINDALFDHRQNLMLNAMRAHHLPEPLIARWAQYEEQFRVEIVKYKPWPKRFGDLAVDTEQYETCLLEEASICDYCGSEIYANTMVKYHKRIGKIGCAGCTTGTQDRAEQV